MAVAKTAAAAPSARRSSLGRALRWATRKASDGRSHTTLGGLCRRAGACIRRRRRGLSHVGPVRARSRNGDGHVSDKAVDERLQHLDVAAGEHIIVRHPEVLPPVEAAPSEVLVRRQLCREKHAVELDRNGGGAPEAPGCTAAAHTASSPQPARCRFHIRGRTVRCGSDSKTGPSTRCGACDGRPPHRLRALANHAAPSPSCVTTVAQWSMCATARRRRGQEVALVASASPGGGASGRERPQVQSGAERVYPRNPGVSQILHVRHLAEVRRLALR